MAVGENIRRARRHYGLTQTELAKKIGMTRVIVQYWETNRTKPRKDSLEKLSWALDVRVNELLREAPKQDDSGLNPLLVRELVRLSAEEQRRLILFFRAQRKNH